MPCNTLFHVFVTNVCIYSINFQIKFGWQLNVIYTHTQTHTPLSITITDDLLSLFLLFLFRVFATPHGAADSSLWLPQCSLLSILLLFCFIIPFFFHQPQQIPESKWGWLNQFVLHLFVFGSMKRERSMFAIREAPSLTVCLIVPPSLTDTQTSPLISTHAKTKTLWLSPCKENLVSGSNERKLRRKSLSSRDSFKPLERKDESNILW